MRLQIVPARTGATWFWSGIRTFFQQPLALGALFLAFVIVISLPTVVPMVGLLLALALVPMATAGFMAGTEQAASGTFPRPSMIFIALRKSRRETRNVLLLGVSYAIAVLSAIALASLIDGGQFAQVYLGSEPMSAEMAQNPRFRLAMWATMLMYLPVSIAFWHAPALVHWHGVPPLKSIFFSVVAIVRNFTAFVVYGALWLTLSMMASTLLMALAISGSGAGVVYVVFVMMGLLLAAMLFTSLWFTFRDCFPADDAAQPVLT